MLKMYEEWWDDARELLKQGRGGVMTVEEYEEMAQMEIKRSKSLGLASNHVPGLLCHF